MNIDASILEDFLSFTKKAAASAIPPLGGQNGPAPTSGTVAPVQGAAGYGAQPPPLGGNFTPDPIPAQASQGVGNGAGAPITKPGTPLKL